jgi:hypothetical protein
MAGLSQPVLPLNIKLPEQKLLRGFAPWLMGTAFALDFHNNKLLSNLRLLA